MAEREGLQVSRSSVWRVLRAAGLMSPHFPVRSIQTDKGWELERRFHQVCEEVHIQHDDIHKSRANENAVIERSFRTDEDEFFLPLSEPDEDIKGLQRSIQRYLQVNNTVRPHMGINKLTPKEVVSLYHKS